MGLWIEARATVRAVVWGRLSGGGVLRGEGRGQGRAGPADLAFGLAPMRIASITAGEPSKAPRARICDTTASKVCFSIMPGECSAAPLQRRARSRRRARIQRGERILCRSRYGANQSTMYCSSSEAGLVPRHALPLAALPASSRTRRWRRIIMSSFSSTRCASRPADSSVKVGLVSPPHDQSPNLGASHQACHHSCTSRRPVTHSLSHSHCTASESSWPW